jgi:hypothetical protein
MLNEKVKRQAWEDDMVWIKFINLERKGEQHTFTVNGRFFTLKHGEIAKVPRAVVHALEDAVKIEWKVESVDINGVSGKKIEKYKDPRMSVTELGEEQAMRMMSPEQRKKEEARAGIISEESKQDAIIDDIIKTQTSSQQAANDVA